ncbi:MAG TPA: translation initiation factor IF-2 associated domain-containing protein, partial [Allosphingosinicella sp.]|nr:translation initiation factor IF-2 associated domain-containing protein [Allosphingosinicella sp.]
MSDTTDKPKLGTRAPLGLKRTVETGKVKQSFSHGRSNTVVVEVKKRRILGPGTAQEAAPPPVQEAPKPAAPAPAPAARAPQPAPQPSAQQRPATDAASRRELQERLLREAEEARLATLEEARRREDRQLAEASEEERRRAEDNRRAEDEARAKAEQDARDAARQAEEEASRPAAAAPAAPAADEEEERRGSAGARPAPRGAPPKRPEPARPVRGRDDRRDAGKLTVTRALTGDDDRTRSLAALRRAREKDRRHHQQSGPAAKQVRDVIVPDAITVQELANRMAER